MADAPGSSAGRPPWHRRDGHAPAGSSRSSSRSVPRSRRRRRRRRRRGRRVQRSDGAEASQAAERRRVAEYLKQRMRWMLLDGVAARLECDRARIHRAIQESDDLECEWWNNAAWVRWAPCSQEECLTSIRHGPRRVPWADQPKRWWRWWRQFHRLPFKCGEIRPRRCRRSSAVANDSWPRTCPALSRTCR